MGRIADLVLENDKSVSRVHGHLEPKKDHVMITDANSKYGTFLNDGIENLEVIASNIIYPTDVLFLLYFRPCRKELPLELWPMIGSCLADSKTNGCYQNFILRLSRPCSVKKRKKSS